MSEIVLTTLNARYIHTAFGLRYLFANLGELKERATIHEFTIQQRAHEIVEQILSSHPRIVGFGVYIWNVQQITEVAAVLKRVSPQTVVVIGGPEVSYEVEDSPLYNLVDYIITGEADLEFCRFCQSVLVGDLPTQKVIRSPLPNPAEIAFPYDYYNDDDIENRVIYVEASRGCPFTCEFCLSSLDIPVRQFDLDSFLHSMKRLCERGVRKFKFVDRTFNLNLRISKAILEFFLERYQPDLFVHFELVPDRLPEALREIIARFPPGALQFEIGIQTFDEEVAKNISRRQDYAKVDENIRYLRAQTGVHLHVDLIAGLPGETLESFAAGFDRLVSLNPQEIQVGILKRLRGTPIVRHDQEWGMTYAQHPPYELLKNKLLDFKTMQRLGRFSRFWDMVANSGNFRETRPLLWRDRTPFTGFMAWSDWLFANTNERHGYSVKRLAEFLFKYLTAVSGIARETAALALVADYMRIGARDFPQCLKEFVDERYFPMRKTEARTLPERQLKHLP